MKTLYSILFFLLANFALHAQDAVKLPDINESDDEIKVTKVELSEPQDGEDNVIKTLEISGKGESRIAFYNLGYIVRPVVIVAMGEGQDFEMSFMKKGWDDKYEERKLQSKNGKIEAGYKIGKNFGIKTNLKTDGTIQLAVLAGKPIVPQSNLMVDIKTMGKAGKNTQNADESNGDNTSGKKSSNLVLYVIIGVLVLLFVFVLGRKKTFTIVLFCFASASYSQSAVHLIVGAVEVAGNLQEMADMAKDAKEMYDLGKKGMDFLSGEDKNYEAQLDPAGQPSLPSSCLSAQPDYNSSEGQSYDGQSSSNSSSQDGSSSSDDSTNNDSNSSDNENLSTESGTETDSQDWKKESKVRKNKWNDKYKPKKDATGKKIKYSKKKWNGKFDKDGRPKKKPSGEKVRYPGDEGYDNKYDEYGRARHDADGNEINYPPDGHQYDEKYDEYGRARYDSQGNQIKYPDDWFSKYDEYGRPRHDADGNYIHYPRDPSDRFFPKYDKYGNGIDYDDNYTGDYNYQGLPVYDENGIKIVYPDDAYIEKETSYNPPQELSPKRYSYAGFMLASVFFVNDDESGCACLQKEYDQLYKIRLQLEKNRLIAYNTKKTVDWALNFGDNFSKATNSGIGWIPQRAKIQKKFNALEKNYTDYYNQMMGTLYETLQNISACEEQLGEDNWYGRFGFMYYEFMKVRYVSYD